MVRPLFHSMSEELKEDYPDGKFHAFRKGWLLPICDLHKGEKITIGQQFLSSFLSGTFVHRENEKEPCAYYFTSQFGVVITEDFLLGYSPAKAGVAKYSTKVHAKEDLVVIEYPNCGTLVVNCKTTAPIMNILESQ